MSTSLRILPARPEDLPSVSALAGVIWRAHYPGIISDEQIEFMLARGYNLDALAREVAGPHHWLDLAWLDGRMVGLANCHLTAAPGEMKLDKLYVLQRSQGRGVGSSLIRHVDARACALGCDRLILNVNTHNASSIRVYERNGFRVREKVVVDIGGGFVMDDYVMERVITYPPTPA